MDKTFEELIDGYGVVQQDYFCLLVRKVSSRDAARLIKRDVKTIENWRINNPNFLALEEYLISNRDKYEAQAMQAFTGRLAVLDEGLYRYASKIMDLETVPLKERACVIRCYQLLRQLFPHKKTGEMGSYEESLLKGR